jgi:hypothetical protein
MAELLVLNVVGCSEDEDEVAGVVCLVELQPRARPPVQSGTVIMSGIDWQDQGRN